MKTYPPEHWQALGNWIASARAQAGHSETKQWAALVKRSTRQLLGLERGEVVGPKTIEAVASALGVDGGVLFSILDSGAASRSWIEAREAAQEAEDRRALSQPQESMYWTNPEGDEADNPVSWSHMEGRLSEIEERISRIERSILRVATRWEGGDGSEGDPAPIGGDRSDLSEEAPNLRSVAKKGNVEPEDGALNEP